MWKGREERGDAPGVGKGISEGMEAAIRMLLSSPLHGLPASAQVFPRKRTEIHPSIINDDVRQASSLS